MSAALFYTLKNLRYTLASYLSKCFLLTSLLLLVMTSTRQKQRDN